MSQVVTLVLVVCVPAFSLVVNSVMLWILLKNHNLRSLTTVFFLSLALSHVIFTVGLLCVGFSAFIRDPHSLLKAAVFCLCSGFFSSTLLLMMMSFHRYLLVLHPLSDPQSHDSRHGITVSIITWTVSFSAAVTLLGDHDSWISMIPGVRINIFFFLFLAVALFCFLRIFQTQRMITGERKDRTVRVIFRLVGFYSVLWTPFCIVVTLNLARGADFTLYGNIALIISLVVASLYCFLNSIFYICLREKVTSHTGSQSSTNLPVSTENESFRTEEVGALRSDEKHTV